MTVLKTIKLNDLRSEKQNKSKRCLEKWVRVKIVALVGLKMKLFKSRNKKAKTAKTAGTAGTASAMKQRNMAG